MSAKLAVFLFCLFGSAFGVVEVIQDGNYILEYNMIGNDTYEITATVNTTGWIGVGLSTTGNMNGADLILGGVDENGTQYIGDFFAISNSRPIEDIENNILSFQNSENATHTVMSFRRLGTTADLVEDLAFESATHILWAYSDVDGLIYHGNINRGSIPLSKL